MVSWFSPFSITFKLMTPACLPAGPRETCLVLISILQISLWECLRFLRVRGEESVTPRLRRAHASMLALHVEWECSRELDVSAPAQASHYQSTVPTT